MIERFLFLGFLGNSTTVYEHKDTHCFAQMAQRKLSGVFFTGVTLNPMNEMMKSPPFGRNLCLVQ